MKFINVLLLFVLTWSVGAQEMRLKKGVVMADLKVHDTLSESLSLYLPTSFESDRTWPVLFVFDMKGRGKRALSMFVSAAEEQGYILAASNSLSDSLSLSSNILISSRMLNRVCAMLPIKNNAIYVGGNRDGGRFASLVPSFMKEVTGVLSSASSVANREVLSGKRPFYFIGIVGDKDYSYSDMLDNEKFLNKLRYPNQLLKHRGGRGWPPSSCFNTALEYFKLALMAKNPKELDKVFVHETYEKNKLEAQAFLTKNELLFGENKLSQMLEIYRPLMNVDSLKEKRKSLRRSKPYRVKHHEENAVRLKESFMISDYNYYIEIDIIRYNYNNLGWWKYQKEQIAKLARSPKTSEKKLSKRLNGYLKALSDDHIDMIKGEAVVDKEALNFVYMLKTIIAPMEHANYLQVISYSSKNEDYGTALFYLEELLMNGYTNKEELYTLEHTALLRITPEFNETVAKYLKEARYDIMEE